MPEKIVFTPIGVIHSPFTDPRHTPRRPGNGSESTAVVEIFPQFKEALMGLEKYSQIIIIFHFHRIDNWMPVVVPRDKNEEQGVFATRSPYRPNPIGVSTVRLVKTEGNRLTIQNIDMMDGTPVLDIKPCTPHDDFNCG